MTLLARWFGKAARLSSAQASRLERWRALAEPNLDTPSHSLRHVVVDVEASGLNMHRDRLIAIGAIAVVDAQIEFRDSFRSVLRQEKISSDENILVHGIGGTAQSEGGEPAEVLLAFLEFIGKSPLIGFHAPFDDIMVGRAMRRYLGCRFDRTWIDLAWLSPALVPEKARNLKALDDWTAAFDIANPVRHDALADALATAQLFQVMMQRAAAQGLRGTRELLEAARSQEWITKQKR